MRKYFCPLASRSALNWLNVGCLLSPRKVYLMDLRCEQKKMSSVDSVENDHGIVCFCAPQHPFGPFYIRDSGATENTNILELTKRSLDCFKYLIKISCQALLLCISHVMLSPHSTFSLAFVVAFSLLNYGNLSTQTLFFSNIHTLLPS